MSFMQPQASKFTLEEILEITPEDIDPPEEGGWFSRLSAPGYLDCTDWSGPYASRDLSLKGLAETFDLCPRCFKDSCGEDSYPCCRSGDGHETPQHTFDWAFPIDWIMDVQKVLKGTEIYKPLGGHIVWAYGPDDGVFGRPVALCEGAQRVLDAYTEKKGMDRYPGMEVRCRKS